MKPAGPTDDGMAAGSSKRQKRMAESDSSVFTQPTDEHAVSTPKKPRLSNKQNSKGKAKAFSGPDPVHWPEYFREVRILMETSNHGIKVGLLNIGSYSR
jgi:hypothetical protein